MKFSILDFGKMSVALLVAWLESVSVFVFVWAQFYSTYPALCVWAIYSVFVLNVFGAHRNTNKIQRLLDSPQNINNFWMNVGLSSLVALVGFLSKRFVLMIFFTPTPFLENLSMSLVLIYSCYTMLNTLADMKEISKFLTFKENKGKWFDYLYNSEGNQLVLYAVLTYAILVTCHYKTLEVSVSIASLIKGYGGAYQWLHYCRRLICFPIVSIGFYNIYRCSNKIKQLYQEKGAFGWFEGMYFCMVLSAAYSQAISSKSIVLSSGNSLFANVCSRSGNYCRQTADKLPCHKDVK